jgi:hypothetical protein
MENPGRMDFVILRIVVRVPEDGNPGDKLFHGCKYPRRTKQNRFKTQANSTKQKAPEEGGSPEAYRILTTPPQAARISLISLYTSV